MEIKLNQVDVAKLNLREGDSLMITVTADLDDWSVLNDLSKSFKEEFPNNKIIVLGFNHGDKVEYSVISKLNPAPVSLGYCNDCNCGKKEQSEKVSV